MVRSRPVAMLGMAGVGIIAVLMLQGATDLVGAAKKGLVLLVFLVLLERLLLPLARTLVGAPTPPAKEP